MGSGCYCLGPLIPQGLSSSTMWEPNTRPGRLWYRALDGIPTPRLKVPSGPRGWGTGQAGMMQTWETTSGPALSPPLTVRG